MAALVTCTDINLTSGMKDLVLTFTNGKKKETLTFPLPPTIVLERDPETGEALKTDGPFKNGKLKPGIVLSVIRQVLDHYYGPKSHDAAERVDIWVSFFDTFPAKIKSNSRNFRENVLQVRDWCDKLLSFDQDWEDSINSFMLRRTTLRTLNRWASDNEFNDVWPVESDDDAEEETEIEEGEE